MSCGQALCWTALISSLLPAGRQPVIRLPSDHPGSGNHHHQCAGDVPAERRWAERPRGESPRCWTLHGLLTMWHACCVVSTCDSAGAVLMSGSKCSGLAVSLLGAGDCAGLRCCMWAQPQPPHHIRWAWRSADLLLTSARHACCGLSTCNMAVVQYQYSCKLHCSPAPAMHQDSSLRRADSAA